MSLRVSPFLCGVVFAIGGFGLCQAVDLDNALGAVVPLATMLISLAVAIWAERRAEAEAFELAEYRRDQLAYERRVAGITADVDREAARLSLN